MRLVLELAQSSVQSSVQSIIKSSQISRPISRPIFPSSFFVLLCVEKNWTRKSDRKSDPLFEARLESVFAVAVSDAFGVRSMGLLLAPSKATAHLCVEFVIRRLPMALPQLSFRLGVCEPFENKCIAALVAHAHGHVAKLCM